MLWVDKYRPHTFDKFILHRDVADHMKKLVATGDCPHTLFYGPPGAGKKTLVMALLREIYGAPAEKVGYCAEGLISPIGAVMLLAQSLRRWQLHTDESRSCDIALHPICMCNAVFEWMMGQEYNYPPSDQ